ncbi:MFS transporter, partial [Salmonella enterica subsp. enterica serovar Bovismorbificans]|nr:MFS transporter [Salmonella enterica subsp. enterica serovar Bovismorbificans]
TLPAWSLFVVLIIAIVFAWALMLKGMRIPPTQQAITC